MAATISEIPHLLDPPPAAAGPVAQAPAARTPAACPADRPDEVSAAMAAKLCGQRVEITHQRTETTQVFANPDGTLTREQSLAPVRVRQGDAWAPVDLTLRRNADGSVTPAAHPRGLRLSGGSAKAGENEVVSLGKGDDRTGFSWRGPLPEPVLDGARAVYAEVLPGVDLVLQAHATGYQQYFEVKNRAALARVRKVSMPMRTGRLTATSDKMGGLLFRDQGGKVLSRAQTPEMWDAEISPQSLEHVNRGRVALRTTAAKAGRSVLELTPDAEFLARDDLEFPVTIDPPTSVPVSFDTFVQTGYTSDQSGSGDLKLGYSDDGGSWVARSFLRFDTTGIWDSQIIGAQLRLWNYHSWSCAAAGWEAWRTDHVDASARINNQPVARERVGVSTQTKGFTTSCGDGWVSTEVGGALQAAASSRWNTVSVMLRGSSENNHNSWKRFHSSEGANPPSVSITYNAAPATPTALAVTPCYASCGAGARSAAARPTLTATLQDANAGQALRAEFELRNKATTNAVASSGQLSGEPAWTNGSAASWQVGVDLVDNTVYQWRVRARDPHGDGAWSEWIDLTVDTDTPGVPFVSAAVYLDDGKPHGGAGQPDTFTFRPATDTTDLAAFVYRLDTDTDATTVAATAGTGVTISPPDGLRTLTVQAKDRAGNLSSPHHYTFSAGNAALAQPLPGATVVRRTKLEITTPVAGYTRAYFEYRRGPGGRALPVPSANLVAAGGAPVVATPASPVALATLGRYAVWNATDTLGQIGGVVEVRARMFTASSAAPVYDTPWVRVTVDANGDRGADTEVGAGMVNLLTGDHGVQASDVDEHGLAVTRSSSSRLPTSGYVAMPERLSANQQQISTDLTGFKVPFTAAAARSTALGQGEETPVDSLEITPVAANNSDTYVAVGGDDGTGMALGMQAGRTYRMTGWIYVPATSGLVPGLTSRGLRIVGFTKLGSTYHEVASPMAAYVDGWQELSLDLTVPAGATEAFFRLYNGHLGGSGRKVYWDNLSMTEVVAPFGPAWSSGATGGPAAGTYTTLTFPEPAVAQINTLDGSWITFSRSADGSTFVPEPGVEELTLSRPDASTYRLTDSDATVTEFRQQGGIWAVTSAWTAFGNSTTRYHYDTAGGRMLLKRVVNPVQPGIDDAERCGGATLPRGCEVLEYVYAASTAAGLSQTAFGDYTDRITAAKLWTWDPAASATTAVEVVRYAYDDQGRLRQVWDPRIGPAAATRYDYDAAGRVATVTPAGELPWTADYGNPDVDAAALRWDLDGSATDTSGSNRHGTGTGIGWGQGTDPANPADRAVTFTAGAGAQITAGGAALSNTASYTVAAWVKLNDRSVNRTAVSKDGNRTSGFLLNYVAATDRWTFSRISGDNDSGTPVRAQSNTAPTLGQWTHLAGVYDTATGQMRLYVNGIPQSSIAPTGGWEATGGYVIGRAKWAGAATNLWSGALDDVRVYGSALTDEQVADLAGDENPGRLLRVRRAALQQGSKTATDGEVAIRLVYNVPLARTAGGPHDMTAAAVAAWGQSDTPTDAVAIFGPQDDPGRHSATPAAPGAGGYPYATVHYLNAHGQEVNTAAPGGHVDTQEYDRFGNIVRSLEATDRALALGTLPDAADHLAELGLLNSDTASRAHALSATNTYSSDGIDVLDTVGPTVTTVLEKGIGDPDGAGPLPALAAGAKVIARPRVAMKYDEDKPDGAKYHLVTTRTQGASIDGYPAVDLRTTRTGYAAEHGGASGWSIKRATRTVTDAGGADATTYRVHDTSGRLVRSLGVGSTGSDARAIEILYYTVGAHPADPGCGNRPEWAGELCLTRPGGAVTGHDPDRMSGRLPVRRIAAYNRYGDRAVLTETVDGQTRTTTTTYDAAARVVSQGVTSTEATPVPTATIGYDPATGRVVSTSTPDATITREYDLLGRLVRYTDADGGMTATEFDRFGQRVRVSDPTGSSTYAYDRAREPRGMVTSVTDNVAGTFTAGYAPDGQLTTLRYPGGLTRSDELGANLQPVRRTYTRDSDGAVVYSEAVVANSAGQWVEHTYTGGSKRHSYDRRGRLTSTRHHSALTGGCVNRTYTYDERTNRTTRAVFDPAADGSCTEATPRDTDNHTYDSADRLVDAGFTYDAFGRTTRLPDGVSTDYFANDMVRVQQAGDSRQTWTLDPALRLRGSQVQNQADGAWTTATQTVNHFGDDTDAPRWIAENTTGMFTRMVSGPDEDLAATVTSDGAVRLQLTNLHGDVAATIDPGLTQPELFDYDEFGTPVDGQSATRYGWLGAKQRSGEAMGDHLLMGVRLYSPSLGRFLQVDPVLDGGCNAYEYVCADPVNQTDLEGKAIPAIIIAIVGAARLAWQACRISKKWCAKALRWVGDKVAKYMSRAIAWVVGALFRLSQWQRVKNGLTCASSFSDMMGSLFGEFSKAKGYPGGAKMVGWIAGFLFGFIRNFRCTQKTRYS